MDATINTQDATAEKWAEKTSQIIENAALSELSQPAVGRRINIRCQLSPGRRFQIFRRDGYRCRLCGQGTAHGKTLEVDHKIPIAKGGSDHDFNLWTLCFDCNRGKSDELL